MLNFCFLFVPQVSVAVAFGIFRGVPLTFGDVNENDVTIGTDADFFAGGVMVAALLISPLLFLLYLLQLANIQQTVLVSAVELFWGA